MTAASIFSLHTQYICCFTLDIEGNECHFYHCMVYIYISCFLKLFPEISGGRKILA